MFAGACIGTNDLKRAASFYSAVLGTIGLREAHKDQSEIGYADSSGEIRFWVLRPYDGKIATAGNGTQIMFMAANQHQVQEFHRACLALGGEDDGAPGPRDYHPGYYGAYCRDPDGNKLHIYYRP